MSMKSVKHGVNQVRTALGMDLSLSSFYYKPCSVGIMIINHLCLFSLKKQYIFSIRQVA